MNNQKGFTLVELLIGMVILSIVTAALTGFIVSSSKSYAASNTEIVVQQESQLAMNQISDVVIDTTRSVNYVGYSLDGSTTEQAVKDADFTIDVEDKSLTLFNGEGKIKVDADGNPVLDADGNPEIEKLVDEAGNVVLDADGNPKLDITGGNGNKNYQIYWDKSEERLYYSEIEISETEFPESDRVVLAEFVKDFSVDLSQVEEKRVVSITISYEYNNRLYETSNNITIRNKVLVNNVNLAVNKSVELNIRPKENIVILEPGETYYKFSTPIIDGRNVIDKSVTWSIPEEEKAKLTDAAGTQFTDDANGMIHISSSETANSFNVKVMTNAVDSAGNHAEALVTVQVKRVKDVSLSKVDSDTENSANEISAGSDITINASVIGNQLGYTCSNCGDSTTIDKYVVENENSYQWNVIDPDNICTMNSSDHGHATFSISSAAQPGQQVIIEATSLLSVQTNQNTRVDGSLYGRKYTKVGAGDALAPVTGRIVLTVANHNSDLTIGGDFRYGDEPLTLTWDYPNAYALVCVRINNLDKTEPEKIMIYNTDGKDIRVGADLFGLDLNYNYAISMQVLDYQLTSGGSIITHAGFHENCNDNCKDFVNNEYIPNCDSTGTYSGDIKASSKITVILHRPQLTVSYNGKKYEAEKVDLGAISALQGAVTIPCNVTAVSSTRTDGERVLNYVKADVYFDGKELYYYNKDSNSYVGNSEKGPLKFSNCSVDNGLQLKVALEDNGNAKDAVGSYSFVPFFSYSNKADATRYIVHYANYAPDYALHYYTREESTISFKIIGGNMRLVAYVADNSKLRRGDIYFPVPSDTNAFAEYFDTSSLEDGNVHYSKKGISTKLYRDDGNKSDINISSMTCQYIVTDGKPRYELKLFYSAYDMLFGRYILTTAGTFVCDADGSEWIQKYAGPLDADYCDNEIRGVGNAKILVDGYQGNTYIPLPTDSDFENTFGFNLDKVKADGKQIGYTSGSIKYRGMGGDTPDARYKDVECRYDKDTKTYTLILDIARGDGDFNDDNKHWVSTFTFKEGDMAWTKVD